MSIKSRLFPVLCLVVLPAAIPLAAQQNSNWQFKNEKEGVKVYYRESSGVHEAKLTTSIKTSLSGLLQLFNEVEMYPQWGYKISESRLVDRISETEFIYYSRIDFPWPLSDRDIVMHSRLGQDPSTRRVTSVSVAEPWHVPEVKDVVRIRDAHTRWIMYPNNSGWLYVEYHIYSDPGGMIPSWLVNLAIDMGPLETIKGIRRKVGIPKYQNAKLAYIKE